MKETSPLKPDRSYAILGTGALGGFYGGRLQRAGLDVHFLVNSDYQHVSIWVSGGISGRRLYPQPGKGLAECPADAALRCSGGCPEDNSQPSCCRRYSKTQGWS